MDAHIDAEMNPRFLAVELLVCCEPTCGLVKRLIARHGDRDLALQALNEAHDAVDQLLAGVALALRTDSHSITTKAYPPCQ